MLLVMVRMYKSHSLDRVLPVTGTGCESRTPVDVIWLLPNEADSTVTDSSLQLVSTVADSLDMGPTSVQVHDDA